MTIKSLHGKVTIRVQRFIEEGKDITYFDLTQEFQEGYVSERVKEFSVYYSNRISYQEVEGLIEKLTGEKLLSDQKIREIVVNKAVEVSKEIREQLKINKAEIMPEINSEVEIYNKADKEILLFDDAILVKEQKASREKSTTKSEESSKVWVSSDVITLEKADGGFQYITALIDEKGQEIVSLEEVVRAKVIEEYADKSEPLNIVAITDGAKAIRSHLVIIFGVTITIILDWYHLVKRIREFMSMIARNKEEKVKHLQFIFYHLWRGNTEFVFNYLTTQVIAKNPLRLKELIEYLQKHNNEIIDYDKRKKAGKTIGSGRAEKSVDLVIGHRQKGKGMSWRDSGSKSLAILKTFELNHSWQHLWFPDQIAA